MFSKYKSIIFIPTEKELKKIFNINDTKIFENFKYSFINNTPVIITGIGKTNTAITSSLFFYKYNPKNVILTGICGAYRQSGLCIGDIVSIEKDYFVDEASFDGVNLTLLNEKSLPIHDTPFLTYDVLDNYNIVVSNTVSLIATNDELSNIYQKKTNAFVENMEGASFRLSALNTTAKIYQIRAISNYCGSNPEWDIKKSSTNLKNAIIDILNSF